MLKSILSVNGRVKRALSVVLTAAMFFTSFSLDPVKVYADELDSEVETVEAEEVSYDAEGESPEFEVWFNNDGTTSIAAGQVGDYPVYAGEAMAAKTNKITVDGVDHYSVQGLTNPKRDNANPNGKIPDLGAYLKVVAPADGTITVFGYPAAGKPFYATKSDDDAATANLSGDTFCDNNRHTVSVHEGEEWYFYAQGSKAQFVGVAFDLPKQSYDIPISFTGDPLGEATITFTNETTKDTVVVDASSTTVSLVESYVYSVAINSALLMIDVESVDLSESIPESIVINVETASQHAVSGTIKGLPEGAAVTALSFEDESGAETDAVVDGNSYTVSLKNGNYTAKATTDAEGYTVYDHVAVTGTEGEEISNDVWFYGAAPVYGTEYKSVLKAGKAEGTDYETITEAVAAAKAMAREAGQWVTIELTDAEYVEQVIVNTNNIKLVAAEGVNPTIRWYYGIGYKYYSIDATGFYNLKNANDKFDMHYAQRWGATIRVTGTGFIAEGIDFVNTFNLYVCDEEVGDSKVGSSAEYGQSISGTLQERTLGLDVANGTNVERAAAIALDGDQAELYQCSFTSSQDTVYVGSNKSYFNECVLVGQTDYVYGNTGSSAIFDNCELKWLGYTQGGKAGYIAVTRGSLLFRGCKITSNSTAGYTVTPGYLGRPWANTAKVAFVGTSIAEGTIAAAGWTDMSGVQPTAAEFREYGNCIGSELTDDSSKFFYTTYAADTENNSFALSKEAGEALADVANDTVYFGAWAPVNKAAALDLSAVEEWSSVSEPEEEPDDSGIKVTTNTFDAAVELAALEKNAVIALGTKYVNNYFTVNGTANAKRANSSTYAIEVGASMASYLEFVVEGTAEVKVIASSTGGTNTSAIQIIDSNGKVVSEKTSAATVYGSAATTLNYDISEPGTYRIGSPASTDYPRGVRIIAVSAKVLTGGSKPARADWSTVEAPVISNVAQTEGTNNVVVTVDGAIGYDAADVIKVTMKDVSGNIISSANAASEGRTRDITLTVPKTGLFKFVAEASRSEEETVKTSEETEAKYLVLKLAAPGVKTVASKGNGVVSVEWESVTEATGYVLTVNGTKLETEYDKDVLSAEITLRVGTNYTFGAVARRERINPLTGEKEIDESAIGTTVKATVVNEIQRAWGFSVYGTSTDTAHNGYIGSVNEGSVTVYSEGGKGKIVPNSTDGLAYYYTKMNPETENFTLEGVVTVDSWTLSNGQDGFGMMVADTIGVNGSTDTVWNNSYMAMVSKVEYYYDKETAAVTTDTTAPKITMKLGVGVLARDGVTTADMEYFNANKEFLYADGSKKATPEGFVTETTTLETSCANRGTGTYNIVGNYTTDPGNTVEEEKLVDFVFSITRNNDGYVITYKDLDGEILGTKTIYDQERTALTQIDPENIYVGFFASRNARITVTDVKLSTIAPEDDAPAGEREITYIAPVYQIESAANANSAAYDLVYYGNADGVISIVDNKGNVIASDYEVTAGTKAHFETNLSVGSTTFTVSVTPDADFEPAAYKRLSNYDTKTFTHTVVFNSFEGSNIYVAPNGSASGYGTKENPLDIYTAVKYVQPGQKILLMEGTYNLSRTVKIERGINGVEGNLIYMMADPEAATRPVLDFNEKCAGMIIAGDYWYYKGFDVTRSQNAQKGIQVSGSHNVLDSINTYKNGNTGIQVSRYKGTDLFDEWPSYNTILNCTSYLNADRGYEDADGFAAKLTVGEGNVFDGCISAFNADDGWDLYAKSETGNIGKVIIKNSVAFMNGYVLDAAGNKVNAGNGNGFKMGGESLSGYHTLINSVAFANKAKGIDSNSCPDIQVYNSTSFDNESYNVAFYTNNALNTDFLATGVISYKKSNVVAEQIKKLGTQDETKYLNNSTFLFDGTKSVNAAGTKVADNWFASLDTASVVSAFKNYIATGEYTTVNGVGITRNADGSINMNGYLELTENASGDGASLESSDVSANEIAVYDVNVTTIISDEAAEKIVENGTKTTLKELLQKLLWESEEFAENTPNAKITNVAFYEVTVSSLENGEWVDVPVTSESVSALIPLPEKTKAENFGFSYIVYHTDAEGNYTAVPSVTGSEITALVNGHAVVAVAYEDYSLREEIVDEWGDIIPEDRLAFASAEDVSANTLWIAGVKDVEYTGSSIKQNIRVYNGKTLLSSKKDYSVEYVNNKNANDASSRKTAPAVIVKAKGNYSGTIRRTFKILPVDISLTGSHAGEFKVNPENVVLAYNKRTQKAKVQLTRNGSALSKSSYELVYPDTETGAYKKPGTYTIIVKGVGNYTGTIEVSETITELILISEAKLSPIASRKYNGTAIEPSVNLTYNKKTLTGVLASSYKRMSASDRAGVDFKYTYSDNLEVGTASITIEGVNKFTGTRTATFKITGYKLSDAVLKNFKETRNYTGTAVTEPAYFTGYTGIKNETTGAYSYKRGTLVGASDEEYAAMSEEDQRAVDYTYSYSNNVEIGKATVVYTGVNAYRGSVKKNFKITGTKLSKSMVSGVEKTLVYTGRQITQDNVVVKNGRKTLVEGTDYVVSYLNNVKAGAAKVVVTGKGKYYGTVAKEFTISPYDINKDSDNRVEVTYEASVTYGKNGAYSDTTVTYTYAGIPQELAKAVDYKVSFKNNDQVVTSLEGLKDSAKPTVTVKGCKNFTGSVKNFFTIAKRDIATTIATATDVVVSKKKGVCNTTVIKLVDNQATGTDKYGEALYNVNKLSASDYKVLGFYYAETVGEIEADTLISDSIVVPAGTKVYALLEGKNKYEGTVKAYFDVTKKLLTEATVTFTEKVYFTGEEIEVDESMLKVMVGTKTLSTEDYEITSVVNDVANRKVTVTIEGTGNYGGKKIAKLSVSKKIFTLN